MKIAFLLPVTSQVRYRKRIDELEKNGISSSILAFERDYYPGKPFNKKYILLGNICHGKYHKRLIPFIKAFFKVRKSIKDTEAIYAFGLDVLLLGWVANIGLEKKPRMVLEVADIRGVLLKKGFTSYILRWIERYLLNKINLLVVTSQAYINEYYEKIQNVKDLEYIVIENKLSTYFNNNASTSYNINLKSQENNTIKIGYFGVIRCQESWQILKEIAQEGEGRIQIYIRGFPLGIDNLKKEANEITNIVFDGPYVVPDDLATLYGEVDIIWAIAGYHRGIKGNLTWLRANRFYEACYFKKPMITQYGTQDGKVVEEMDLGLNIDLGNADETKRRILGLRKEELMKWKKNIESVPECVYMYTDEHKKLLEKIK